MSSTKLVTLTGLLTALAKIKSKLTLLAEAAELSIIECVTLLDEVRLPKYGYITAFRKPDITDVSQITADIQWKGNSSETTVTPIYNNIEARFNFNEEFVWFNFYNQNGYRAIDLSHLDTSNMTNGYGMFRTAGLDEINIKGKDFSKITNFGEAFKGNNIKELDFSGCKFAPESKFTYNTSNIWNNTAFNCFLEDCTELEKINLGNMNLCNMLNRTFTNCSKLKEIDFSNVFIKPVNMCYTFWNCGVNHLEFPNFDSSKLVYMGSTFLDMANLESIDVSNIDTSKVTFMQNIFGNCGKLKSLDLSAWRFYSVTEFGWGFQNCTSLETLIIPDFDLSGITVTNGMNFMFDKDSNLTNVKIGNLGKTSSVVTTISLRASNKITRESVQYTLIDHIYDRTANGLGKLNLGLHSTVKALLTDAEKAALTAKGYTLT